MKKEIIALFKRGKQFKLVERLKKAFSENGEAALPEILEGPLLVLEYIVESPDILIEEPAVSIYGNLLLSLELGAEDLETLVRACLEEGQLNMANVVAHMLGRGISEEELLVSVHATKDNFTSLWG